MSDIREIQAMIDSATRAPARYFIVSQVDTTNKKAKLKRTASSPETRWISYNPDLTLAVNDRVRVEGEDINTSVISHKV